MTLSSKYGFAEECLFLTVDIWICFSFGPSLWNRVAVLPALGKRSVCLYVCMSVHAGRGVVLFGTAVSV